MNNKPNNKPDCPWTPEHDGSGRFGGHTKYCNDHPYTAKCDDCGVDYEFTYAYFEAAGHYCMKCHGWDE
jgi:hypothetical protein